MSDMGDHHQRIEAAMLENAESHRPRAEADDVGSCGCGFWPWSVQHVLVAAWREGGTEPFRAAWADAATLGVERAMAGMADGVLKGLRSAEGEARP